MKEKPTHLTKSASHLTRGLRQRRPGKHSRAVGFSFCQGPSGLRQPDWQCPIPPVWPLRCYRSLTIPPLGSSVFGRIQSAPSSLKYIWLFLVMCLRNVLDILHFYLFVLVSTNSSNIFLVVISFFMLLIFLDSIFLALLKTIILVSILPIFQFLFECSVSSVHLFTSFLMLSSKSPHKCYKILFLLWSCIFLTTQCDIYMHDIKK